MPFQLCLTNPMKSDEIPIEHPYSYPDKPLPCQAARAKEEEWCNMLWIGMWWPSFFDHFIIFYIDTFIDDFPRIFMFLEISFWIFWDMFNKYQWWILPWVELHRCVLHGRMFCRIISQKVGNIMNYIKLGTRLMLTEIVYFGIWF